MFPRWQPIDPIVWFLMKSHAQMAQLVHTFKTFNDLNNDLSDNIWNKTSRSKLKLYYSISCYCSTFCFTFCSTFSLYPSCCVRVFVPSILVKSRYTIFYLSNFLSSMQCQRHAQVQSVWVTWWAGIFLCVTWLLLPVLSPCHHPVTTLVAMP